MSDKPRLLSISYHVPYQDAPHAGGSFVYRHLIGMSRHFQVDAVVPATQYTRQAADQSGPDLAVTVVGNERNQGPLRNTVERVRKVRAGVSPGASVASRMLEDARFHDLLGKADIVELQWSEMLVLAPTIRALHPEVPIVCVCHDVITQALTRKAAVAPPHRSVFYLWAARRARAVEPSLLANCRVAFVFSDKDRHLLRSLGATLPVEVIDPNLTSPVRAAVRPARPTALFVGAMDRRENFEGVLEFLDSAWPLVRSRVPDAVVHVVGADPPDFLLARAADDVVVTGRVADLDPWYAGASVFVVPLRLGAGLKFKVPQAMLYGLPVVSTSVGAEGVVDEAGIDVFAGVTDEMAGFADAVARVLLDAEFAQGVGARARQWAVSRYDFAASVDRTAQTYLAVIAEAQRHAAGGQ